MEIRVYKVPTGEGGYLVTTELAKAERLAELHGQGFTTEVHVVEKPSSQQLVQRDFRASGGSRRGCGC